MADAAGPDRGAALAAALANDESPDSVRSAAAEASCTPRRKRSRVCSANDHSRNSALYSAQRFATPADTKPSPMAQAPWHCMICTA